MPQLSARPDNMEAISARRGQPVPPAAPLQDLLELPARTLGKLETSEGALEDKDVACVLLGIIHLLVEIRQEQRQGFNSLRAEMPQLSARPDNMEAISARRGQPVPPAAPLQDLLELPARTLGKLETSEAALEDKDVACVLLRIIHLLAEMRQEQHQGFNSLRAEMPQLSARPDNMEAISARRGQPVPPAAPLQDLLELPARTLGKLETSEAALEDKDVACVLLGIIHLLVEIRQEQRQGFNLLRAEMPQLSARPDNMEAILARRGQPVPPAAPLQDLLELPATTLEKLETAEAALEYRDAACGLISSYASSTFSWRCARSNVKDFNSLRAEMPQLYLQDQIIWKPSSPEEVSQSHQLHCYGIFWSCQPHWRLQKQL
ncbi:hypothetical protein MTO96_040280 [Rhipicephalus appendiculatus]